MFAFLIVKTEAKFEVSTVKIIDWAYRAAAAMAQKLHFNRGWQEVSCYHVQWTIIQLVGLFGGPQNST